MVKYLFFLSAALYLTLLIGGEDAGQQRMGLRGAYDIALALPAEPSLAPEATPDPTATAMAQAPSDTLRILPAPGDPVVQQASLRTPSVATDITLRTITAEAANVRDAASRNGAVIGRLESGEIVQVLETSGDWVHILIQGDGIDGYVHRRLISTEPPGLTATTLFPAQD